MHQPQLTQANSQMTLFTVTSMPIEVSFVLKTVTAEWRHKETEYYIYIYTHTHTQRHKSWGLYIISILIIVLIDLHIKVLQLL